MGTEVLRPQDCLIERMRVAPAVLPRRKHYAVNNNNNPKTTRKQYVRPEKERPEPRKRGPRSEPSISKRSSSDELTPGKNFVLGQVTILKRGESLDVKRKDEAVQKDNSDDLIVCSTERLGPDPEMVPKQVRITDLKSLFSPPGSVRSDMYAGSAFSVSPSPSSLPLPSFSKRREGLAAVDDSATKDLRRLLRLD